MKKLSRISLLFVVAIAFVFCRQQPYQTLSKSDSQGYKYEEVTNDPTKTRIYTLNNGLKVYLSVNKDEPRAMSFIATHAGSVNDPAETTGLAHYLEHMMFKGTGKFGTSNWTAERPLIDSISNLFEQHKATNDPVKKKEIYKEIDRISHKAAEYAIPNEYDKLSSLIGAKATNAFTSYELTAFVNDIPVNEIEKWIKMEYERFQDPVLRLFHTELETVYEEFNMYQDKDQMRANNKLMSGLFPKNPIGRDVIGYPEHLKNPSMVNIMNFYHTWYVPNNMVIVLSGDIDFEKTIKLIDNTFGQFPSKEVPKIVPVKEEPITKPVVCEVTGPEAEQVMFAYRFDGYKSEDRKFVNMIDYILNNSTAGLIDLDLNQKQKVLHAECGSYFLKDYGFQEFTGTPRKGQSLDEVKILLQNEIEKIKKGDFDDWLLQATINNLKLERIRRNESNERAYSLLEDFINGVSIADELNNFDQLSKITKDQIMAFANENYKDNYVIVYKRNGAAKDLVKVEKPAITPLQINRNLQSAFLTDFSKVPVTPIEPVFVDYTKAINETLLSKQVELDYIKNTTNELFDLNYLSEIGSNNNPKLALAIKYLPYLGTDKLNAEAFKKELYKFGLSLNVTAGSDQSVINLNGLNQNSEMGISLLEDLLTNAKPDQEAYDKLVEGIVKERMDQKQDQTAIQTALRNFGKYGRVSPFTNIIPTDSLRKIKPEELTTLIKQFCRYPHRVLYYGPGEQSAVVALIKSKHLLPSQSMMPPPEKIFTEQATDQNKVYLVNYDKSQTDVFMLSKGSPFDTNTLIGSRVFNEYYGGSMGSVVFQEIREARALAYSAFALYWAPVRNTSSFFVLGAVFTQSDKTLDAIHAMNGILNDMIVDDKSFAIARESVLKSIQTERIIKSNIFMSWLKNKKLGIDYDIRKDYYHNAQNANLKEVQEFFNQHFKGRKYNYLLVGNKSKLDINGLKSVGQLEELSLDEIFNY
jgi:predicted Zn-dependent peptidase